MPLRQWPVDLLLQGFKEMNPTGRLLMTKVYALALDMSAEREARLADSP
jgi:hypothetical protein